MRFMKKLFRKNKKIKPQNQIEVNPKNTNESRTYDICFDKYNDFGQIVSIFDYIKNPDFEIACKAAQTVNRLFSLNQDSMNNHLYKTFKYLNISISDINKFNRFDKELEITLLCISSMNCNGYSRERALDEIIKLQAQRTIPFIFFRLADWVDPIRKKAEKAIKIFLSGENTFYFIKNHKLIDWLLKVERNELTSIYNQIIEAITSMEIDPVKITKLNERERLFYFKALSYKKLINNEVFNLILTDNYSLIRFLVFEHLEKAEDLKKVLSKLLEDKSQRIRLNAIYLLKNQKTNEYEKILTKLVFDKSNVVRFEARNLLSKICDCNFKLIYQESLSRKKFIVTSILGLSEVSDKTAIPLIQMFLESNNSKVRTASLQGIYNLDEIIGREKAYLTIENNNPSSTRKTAEKILCKNIIDYKRLRKLYNTTDSLGRKLILKLFNRFKCWSVAGDFLKALNDKDITIQLMARNFLKSWDLYTISLATIKTQDDKDYVMTWYNKIKEKGIEVPKNIPFIFRDI